MRKEATSNMAKVTLTPQQQAVVENRGGSLLVSAAAGSGKTKVLVERLFRYVTEEHCNVDDFLIITYTKAAAAELRGKIAQELTRRVAERPGDGHLRRQMLRVYQADIKTVDAFCTALLRESTHRLAEEGQRHALTADFRVLDEQEAALLRQRVLGRVLEDFYAGIEEDENARLLAETLGVGRDDRALEALDALCTPETKVICINNPDNPTGALLDGETLRAIVEVARKNDAWLHCDEVYRHLNQTDEYAESVVDLYDKGVTTSSMSKVWSLAGIRLGWCVTKDEQLRRDLLSHRDYNLISCGLFDEAVGAYALAHADAILDRSRRIVRENLVTLLEWVESEPHLSVVPPEAGTTALVYYDYDIPSYDFCTDMVKFNGAFVTPGDCFEEPKSFRVGYGYSDDTAN